MIATLIARFSENGEREVDRFAAWLGALQKLKADWAGGARPGPGQLRAYLDSVPAGQRSGALQDLIGEHLRLAWQAGAGARLEFYLAEFSGDFPELASAAVVPAELVEDEFLARHQLPRGDTPPPREYEERFPGRRGVWELLARRCLNGGRYVKLKKRGLGAMGEVWEAFDGHLNRLVAIKEPRTDLADRATVLRHFAREARITAGLEHPGLVSIHEFGAGNGTAPFYVMRLVNGKPFNERIREYHRPPATQTPDERRLLWRELLQSFQMVCDAMAHAHAAGVLHRDLKPANIMVDETGEAVVLDWGMAIETRNAECGMENENAGGQSGNSAPVTIAGTPDYMPPEQAGGRADVRSEVFGLGAILFEILTGRSPHGWSERARPADWLRQVREAQFPAPHQIEPKVPRDLEAVCLKALARDPAARYPSALELGRDVRRHLAGEPVSVWREPAWARVRRWLRARR